MTTESSASGRKARDGQLSLFGSTPPSSPSAALVDPDADARAYAVDPRHHVVLEASAGTGKTSVLVARYVNLLKAGVDPANILAITFTRKAAAEMRERIVGELRAAAARSEFDRARWLELRDRLGDIAISTIDAFCLSLLREFPLEADVDPAFDLADETEVPRLVSTALDRALRILTRMARTEPDVALVLAQLGTARTRQGLALLLERRLVARGAIERFLARAPRDLTAARVCATAARALHEALATVPGGLEAFLADGPAAHPRYALFVRAVRALGDMSASAARTPSGEAREPEAATDAAVRSLLDRVAAHFLTADGRARKAGAIPPYTAEHYASKDAARRHREALFQAAPRVETVIFGFARDLNVVLARGVRRMFAIALAQYRQALDERSVLDFSDVLERALDLLRRMDEFAQSRFRLESRYHHVLVDEFQDTSRAQWELVSLLVQAWGEGLGAASSPSIFIVGDRKQSIYRFRDADVAGLHHAADYIDTLRPGSRSRRSITRSFRAVPELLHLVNDIFSEMSGSRTRADEFTYDDRDRFPVESAADRLHEEGGSTLGIAVADSPDLCAGAVADEIVRLLRAATVRDRSTGVARQARPGDIGILFRSRSSHREFERELGSRGVPTYVYKGLGFFDADEIKDLTALLRFLAEPSSALRAAAFLRSRFIRLSDPGLAALAPDLSGALLSADPPPAFGSLDEEDRRVLEQARRHVPQWVARVDRTTPAELLDAILADSAYMRELGGRRALQAWENVKKMRGLVRRIQNRGYATVRRIAEHLMSLSAGDESNAVVEALDAVNLMTVHASKGLEFPIVFVVNLAKGASGPPHPIRVVAGGGDGEGQDEPSVTIGPFLSDTDEAERERERHESRRLLYVALTRARDRLYLAATLRDGVLVPGRGSLAEVLPTSLTGLFGHAGAVLDGVETIGWTGATGREYRWRLCRPVGAAPQPTAESRQLPAPDDDFVPLSTPDPRTRMSASEWAAKEGESRRAPQTSAPDRLAGVLVHRLFSTMHGDHGQFDAPAAALMARELLTPEERAALERPDEVASKAAETWVRARTRGEVVEALAGERLHEVPFSLLLDGPPRLVRGIIDCVVRKPDGSLLVVELKTGEPRAGHQRQLDLYVQAARALHAGGPVSGLLLYL